MELAWDWYQAAGIVSTCGLCVCRGWNHFFLLSLHCDKVEIVRELVQSWHCSEVRQWRGNCNNTCLRKPIGSPVGFMFVSILKKVQRNYCSKILFFVPNSVIFRPHLNCVMETPRNDQRIDRIRVLDSGYRPKLMWIESKKKKNYSSFLNIFK